MRVVMHRVKEATLESFADEHGLTLEIHERKDPSLERYYAHFDNVEVMRDGMLRGTFGNGDTPAAAAEDYAREISLQRIAIGALRGDRREVEVPRLVAPWWAEA